MEGYGKKYHLAVGWSPIETHGDGKSDIVSLKNYQMAEFWIITGAAVTASAAVTMFQGTSITTAATALAFARYFDSGCHLAYDGGSVETPAAAGETAIGTATASGYVYQDTGGKTGVVTLYGRDEFAYVDNEVLTFKLPPRIPLWMSRMRCSETFCLLRHFACSGFRHTILNSHIFRVITMGQKLSIFFSLCIFWLKVLLMLLICL